MNDWLFEAPRCPARAGFTLRFNKQREMFCHSAVLRIDRKDFGSI
jgi:hypothetical protein